jgi:hypothetical protein
MVRAFAASGFSLYHAGDLDPDGILILQELAEAACSPVKPFYMDAATFDTYRDYGRKLEASMLRRISLIKPETLAIPGMASLVGRIQDTGLGVEQEIIDYRANLLN